MDSVLVWWVGEGLGWLVEGEYRWMVFVETGVDIRIDRLRPRLSDLTGQIRVVGVHQMALVVKMRLVGIIVMVRDLERSGDLVAIQRVCGLMAIGPVTTELCPRMGSVASHVGMIVDQGVFEVVGGIVWSVGLVVGWIVVHSNSRIVNY